MTRRDGSSIVVHMKIQLLTETRSPAEYLGDDAWCAQEKINGERLQIHKAGGEVRGFNRRGAGRSIPAATLALALLSPHDWQIDGEIVGDTFTAFDALAINGADICQLPQSARFAALSEVSPFAIVRQSDGDDKAALLASVIEDQGEGVVFKLSDASYQDGRDAAAVKYRLWQSESFVVADIDIAKGTTGLRRDGKDCGRCSFRFDSIWPKVGEIVEVRFSARGKTGKCIHPVMIGTRTDLELV